MKRIITLLIILNISVISYAQENRGLDNRFYIRVGYSSPTNSYFGGDSDSWDNISKSGFMFELGSIFILNNLDLADGLRLGINVDYVDFTYHQFNFEDSFEELTLYLGQISSKVGPSISYNPVSKLVLDAYIKAKIPWVGGGYIAADDPDWDERNFIGYVGFGFSTGLNVRFGALIVGFEYANSSIKLEDRDEPEEYFGNFLDPDDTGEKSKMPNINFTVGVNF
jgi:hypothetical protein